MKKTLKITLSLLFVFICISNNLSALCSCYDTDDHSSEAYKIKCLISSYEDKRELEFLSDRLAPYCFDSKFHRELERLNNLKKDSIRYPHVYKNIIITSEKVNIIRDFWYERNSNEYRKGVPWGVDKKVWEENLAKDRIKIAKRVENFNQHLTDCTAKILNEYLRLFEKCMKDHSSITTYYDYALLAYLNNDFETALELLNKTIDIASKEGTLPDLDAKLYHDLGVVCLETQSFDNAIKYLSESIAKDPSNKAAYFDRATAYFETGSFDLAIQDYYKSQGQTNTIQSSLPVTGEFTSALVNGLQTGASEAIIEFGPTLCNSAYGVGEALWATASHPIDTSHQFALSCRDVYEAIADHLISFSWDTTEEYAEEIKIMMDKFQQLNESEKGQSIGYIIGKYGVDIFAGGAICKGINACRNLKNANRLANLEAIASSKARKDAVVANALRHASERESFFKTIKYNWADHNKHVPTHSYYDVKRNRSIWTHNDPEGLLKKFAGKGQPLRETPGSTVYKERVDFKEVIGYYKTIDGTCEVPTTVGIIHYGKKGAHIIPARPIN